MIESIQISNNADFSFVHRRIDIVSDGRVVLVEVDLITGKTRKRPLREINGFIYVCEYEVGE